MFVTGGRPDVVAVIRARVPVMYLTVGSRVARQWVANVISAALEGVTAVIGRCRLMYDRAARRSCRSKRRSRCVIGVLVVMAAGLWHFEPRSGRNAADIDAISILEALRAWR